MPIVSFLCPQVGDGLTRQTAFRPAVFKRPEFRLLRAEAYETGDGRWLVVAEITDEQLAILQQFPALAKRVADVKTDPDLNPEQQERLDAIDLRIRARWARGPIKRSELVYGPEAFTTGTYQNLSAFDSNWQKINDGAGANLAVSDTGDNVQLDSAGDADAQNRWTGTTLVDQKIVSDIVVADSGVPEYIGFLARSDADYNCYLCEWSSDTGEDVNLYRVVGMTGGIGGSFTLLATGGTVVANGSYDNAYLIAVGTNPVVIEAGDDANGAACTTYEDSNAARHETGQPGLTIAGSPNESTHDNVEIWDEAQTIPGANAPTQRSRFPTQATFAKRVRGLRSWLDVRSWWREALA